MFEALYIAAQILSDIGSLRILSLFGMSIDGGTFVYPITFTLRDMIHKRNGKRKAKKVIWLAAVINIFMVLFFWFISKLPPDMSVGTQLEFNILVTSWRIVLASIIAELFSELADTEIYHWFVTKITEKRQWARVLLSNTASIPIDSIIFCFIAFYGVMPIEIVWSIVLTNIIIKGIVTLLSIPLIYI